MVVVEENKKISHEQMKLLILNDETFVDEKLDEKWIDELIEDLTADPQNDNNKKITFPPILLHSILFTPHFFFRRPSDRV